LQAPEGAVERRSFAARILIGEDNPVNQEVASGILETMGRTVTAPNAAPHSSASPRRNSTRPDGLRDDHGRHRGDAPHSRIRAMMQALPNASQFRRTPSLRRPRMRSTVRAGYLAAGMDDFLVKPFDDRQMAETRCAGSCPPA
jgi:CheY-like chemotaxis protein